MKETLDEHDFANTINTINQLTEEDAKSLLKIIYGFVNTAMTGSGGDEFKIEVVNKISEIYKGIPKLNEDRKK